MDTRLAAVLLSIFLTFSYSSAEAQQQQIRLIATDDGSVVDQFPFDGFADRLESDFLVVQLTDFEPVSETLSDTRAVIEFDISSLRGKTIRRALLELTPSFIPVPEGTFVIPIEVRRFRGNGVVGVKDFHFGAFATAFDLRPLIPGVPSGVNVVQSVRYALANRWKYLGLVLRTNISPSGVSFDSSPTLKVTFE